MGTLKEIANHIGSASSKDFAYRAGVTRQAVSQAYNDSPYLFNRYYNCVAFFNARIGLKKAEFSLRVAQVVYDNVKKYKKEAENV